MYYDARNWADIRPGFNSGEWTQKPIPEPLKPRSYYTDARDLLERPYVQIEDPGERTSGFEEFDRPLVTSQTVEIGDATLDKLLKYDKPDPEDKEWLDERKRRLKNGETEKDLLRNPPFGRKQRTIRVERKFNEVGSAEEKLRHILEEVKKGNGIGSAVSKFVSVLGDLDTFSKKQNELVGNVVDKLKTSGAKFERDDFKINHRYYSTEGFKELVQDNKQLRLYVIGRASLLKRKDLGRPIARPWDSSNPFGTYRENLLDSYQKGVIDMDKLILYKSRVDLENDVSGKVDIYEGRGFEAKQLAEDELELEKLKELDRDGEPRFRKQLTFEDEQEKSGGTPSTPTPKSVDEAVDQAFDPITS